MPSTSAASRTSQPSRSPFPGVERSIDLSGLIRRPNPAQANAVNALVWARGCPLSLILCGEMGKGKSFMGAVAARMHADGKPYRACIMAPKYLIDKWAEEL